MQEIKHTLIESENRFRTLVENPPVAMASLKGNDFKINVLNDAIFEIWGKDRSVVGLPLHFALPEIKEQVFLKILAEVYNSGKPYYGRNIKRFYQSTEN